MQLWSAVSPLRFATFSDDFGLDVPWYLDDCLNIEIMDSLFKALDDPTRRSILELLQRRDLTAGEISDRFQVTKPTISHHLDLLRQAGLVLAEKQGQFVLYSLNTSVVEDCIVWLLKLKGKGKNHEVVKKRMASNSYPAVAGLRRRPALG
jgi:ArsR family transcriptional regulator, arsenate/arsenite/antimonite-responsive transcriptional repressor